MSNGLQQTYIAGRADADKLGSDINEYTKVLYGVAKVLKNRGFNTTANEERAKHEVGELKFFSPRVKTRVKKLTAVCFDSNEKYGVYTRGKSVFL